jgi:hypothetical protein
MWNKIKAALAWVGGILAGTAALFLGLFFVRRRRRTSASALEQSAARAQAEHDAQLQQHIDSATIRAAVHVAQSVEQHETALQEIKDSAHAQAAALQNDLSELAAALDSKAKPK